MSASVCSSGFWTINTLGLLMSIHFVCKSCEKPLKMDDKKFGVLVRCSGCRTINRTPGIAFQKQVSNQQIDKMTESLTKYWNNLVAVIILFPIVLSLMAFLGSFSLPVFFIFLTFAFLLFVRTSTLRQYLGKGIIWTCFWFIVFFPIFVILSVMSYLKLKKRLAVLTEAGLREE